MERVEILCYSKGQYCSQRENIKGNLFGQEVSNTYFGCSVNTYLFKKNKTNIKETNESCNSQYGTCYQYQTAAMSNKQRVRVYKNYDNNTLSLIFQ